MSRFLKEIMNQNWNFHRDWEARGWSATKLWEYLPLAKVLVPTLLLLSNWRVLFSNYHNKMVTNFPSYGWPINYTAPTRHISSLHNHPSASQFASHVQDYIDTESSWNAMHQPLFYPPFPDDFVCSPFQTVPKRDSLTRQVIISSSVNDGIPQDIYLGEHFKLHFKWVDDEKGSEREKERSGELVSIVLITNSSIPAPTFNSLHQHLVCLSGAKWCLAWWAYYARVILRSQNVLKLWRDLWH